MKYLLGVALLGAVACKAPEASLTESLTASVRFSSVDDIEEELRLAVVWVLDSRQRPSQAELLVSFDARVENGTQTEVRFNLLRALDWDRLRTLSTLRLPDSVDAYGRAQSFTAEGYRPRLVLYADRNENGALDVPAMTMDAGAVDGGFTGADELLALDGSSPSIIALRHPRRDVGQLPLDVATAYYELAGGFGRFVFMESSTSQLAARGPVELSRGVEARLLTDLMCGRAVSASATKQIARARVDDGLDAVAVCGLDFGDCESVELDAIEPPELNVEGLGDGVIVDKTGRVAQCKRNGELEVLHYIVATTACVGCSCEVEQTTTTYVARESRVPNWWPCGDTLRYCDWGGLGQLTTPCALSDDSSAADAGGLDSGLTVGRDAATRTDAGEPDSSVGSSAADASESEVMLRD